MYVMQLLKYFDNKMSKEKRKKISEAYLYFYEVTNIYRQCYSLNTEKNKTI